MHTQLNSLPQWLAYLERVHPSEIDLGLQRVAKVADRLGLTKPKATLISVAGTNGKGSCVCTMEALLAQQSLSVGAFTSPHLIHFNERIRVNAENADDASICEAFAAIEAARQEISLTYFEFATLAAFYIFQARQLDYWLLEVGLGGRLDAVNLLDADIAIITSIDLDHQAWLGNTREAIAKEKAGILRNNTPCIVAEPEPPQSLVDIVHDLSCAHYQYPRDFYISAEGALKITASEADKGNDFLQFAGVQPQLPLPSVAAACQALALLKQLPSEQPLKAVLNTLGLAGRFQKVEYQQSTVILDVAHNPAACELLAHKLQQLQAEGGEPCSVTAVVGMMQDKDISACLAPLLTLVSDWITTDLQLPRAATAQQLQGILQQLGVRPQHRQAVQSVAQGLQAALSASFGLQAEPGNTKPRLVLVCGSFYTVAEGLAYLKQGVPS